MSASCAFIQNSPNPICYDKPLIFLLQKALFSYHLMSLYAIWDNLFSYLVKVNQNLKFLHWASILIGNLPVSALHVVIAVFFKLPATTSGNYFELILLDPFLIIHCNQSPTLHSHKRVWEISVRQIISSLILYFL